LAHGRPPDSVYAKYFLDWTSTLDAIVARAPGAVTSSNDLLVINLPRAERALRS